MISILHLELENGKTKDENLPKTEDASTDSERSPRSDKYPAPSTPQLKQGERLLDDGDCQDHTNCSTEKESAELDGESKSVETSCGNSVAEVTVPVSQTQTIRKTVVKKEDDLADSSKSEDSTYPSPLNKTNQKDSLVVAEKPATTSGLHNPCANKANKKKLKVGNS